MPDRVDSVCFFAPVFVHIMRYGSLEREPSAAG